MIPVEPPEIPSDLQSLARRVVFAKDQPQYQPLPAIVTTEGEVTTDWALDDEDLAVLLDGGRIRLTLLTFNRPLQPIRLRAVPAPCSMEAAKES